MARGKLGVLGKLKVVRKCYYKKDNYRNECSDGLNRLEDPSGKGQTVTLCDKHYAECHEVMMQLIRGKSSTSR